MTEGRGVVSKKELSPGIILHKEIIPGKAEGVECIYEFRVELQRLNTLEFTVDFTGSKNVLLDGGSGLVKSTIVQAFETTTVAVLKMTRQWMLKSKFRFIIRAAPRALQEQYLKREIQDLNAKIEKSKQILSKISVNLSSVQEIEQVLTQKGTNFLDIEFPPLDASIYREVDKEPFDQLVHWRRPNEFFIVDYGEGLKDPRIFSEEIEPYDVRQGQLGDSWFMSALASLAERPALIERLFITKQVNSIGIYRIKLCKNGEWVTVTIDDYFPCFPMGQPIFSRANGNELWVLILEKAYAKLHGHYYLLKGGFANEGLIDLTGCPTAQFHFHDEDIQKLIESGQFWLMIKDFDEEGYILSASTQGEERWNEVNFLGTLEAGLLPGHAYTILSIKEAQGNLLINLRNPWGKIDWNGDWSDGSAEWTAAMKRELNPVFDEDNGNFWMNFDDFIQHFSTLNVCRVKNWDEVRIKGKFIRVQDVEDSNMEVVVSKWYYSVDLPERVRIFIGIHQEDERIFGVASRRQYLDIGIVVLKRMPDGTVNLIESKDFSIDRQCEMEILLDPGSYIILPRTSGCLLRRPTDAVPERITLLNSKGELTDLAESTINDIFRKFDMLLNRELSYTEFKGFYECINRTISEVEYRQKVLKKYSSTENGLSLKGFKDFFIENIKAQGEEVIWGWLESLGYDRELYSVRSRCFILTFHSVTEISVTVRDAIQTDLDNRTNVLLIEKQGTELDSKTGVRCFYYLSKNVHCYSYGVYNEQSQAIEVTLDCGGSDSMVFSTKGSYVKKRIEPGQLEFMLHAMAIPSADTFVRSARCTWHAV
ncbi:unnamed protein product [Blepharisma stoltei]|uniref:Calpain catalytic domain-containing protein n=1 Tax=Blepharisma stoltei TaxID=1481888 RepID=A0AAU9JYD5_9CILI|nr:unnamed protein product [Blepharisma stoltei]